MLCKECKRSFIHYFKDGVKTNPEYCPFVEKCNNKQFFYMNKSKTESGFFQRIEVENYMERASYDYTMQA